MVYNFAYVDWEGGIFIERLHLIQVFNDIQSHENKLFVNDSRISLIYRQ